LRASVGKVIVAHMDESLEEIARHLAPLDEEAYAEMLLACFAREIETMNAATLQAFRAYCERWNEGTDVEEAMLEVLDGQIELRELGLSRAADPTEAKQGITGCPPRGRKSDRLLSDRSRRIRR